jgi:hypothetical protein
MLGKVQEGMEDKTASEADEADKAATASEADKTVEVVDAPKKMDTKAADLKALATPSIGSNTSATGMTSAERAAATKMTDSTKGTTSTEKFSQQITPARYNAADDDDMPRHKPKIDYAATLETAYDNLDKLLSSDAIKNMSADTGRLAEKQQMLMGNIEKITPIMEKAGSILKGFDMGAITKLMKNVGGSVSALKENRDAVDIEGA